MRAYSLATGLSARLACTFLSYLLAIGFLAPLTARKIKAEPSARAKASAAGAAAVRRQLSNAPRREGEVIVRFRESVAEQDKNLIASVRGARRAKRLRGFSRLEVLELEAGQDPAGLAADLRLVPEVELAEPNYLVARAEVVPNDARFGEQWALRNEGQGGGAAGADVRAPAAWAASTGAASTVVAVVDSGVDFTHPDLANNRWSNPRERENARDDDRNGYADDLHGWDWVAGSAAIRDEQGHGTAVAGIIAAQGNNGEGVSGVMWRAGLMSLRVLDNTGTGDVADAVEAIDYAVAHGAQVVNCSWGTEAESGALREAISRAAARGVVVVAAAGNGRRDIDSAPYYPASYDLPNLIAVAATDRLDQLAQVSNWGATRVHLAAPGVEILTTKLGGGYWNVTGTSAAAPVVSGVAGLLKTARPALSAEATRRAVVEGARRVASLAGRVAAGGVVNAAGALEAAARAGGNPSDAPGNGNGSGQGNGNGNGQPTVPPPPPQHGGRTPDEFKRTPPTAAAGPNLPNLDEIKNRGSYIPASAPAPIRANLPPICDTCYEPPGGDPTYSNDTEFSNSRSRPENDTGDPGVDLGSRNFNWSTPLLSLPGRAGHDLSLSLFYNSLVWTRQGASIQFNADNGFPGPGFHLGFPTVQERFLDSETGGYAYMMVTPEGGRMKLRYSGNTPQGQATYTSTDSSYTQLIDYGTWALVRTTDGTQFTFDNISTGEKRCTQIKDRNGNYISIAYTAAHRVDYVVDTLGRLIDFVYDADGNLSQLTQSRGASGHTDLLVSFGYGSLWMQPNFPGLNVFGPNGQSIAVLTQVGFPDGSHYNFSYNNYGQVWQILHYAPDGHLLARTGYNLPGSAWLGDSAQSDCPRFTERREWVEMGVMNQNADVVTTYSSAADGSWTQVTTPDGTIHKEFFHTAGWQKGLSYQTEVWSGGVRRRWATTAWTQDDTNLAYQNNPRPYETNAYDAEGNRRRKTVDYMYGYSLPTHVREWGGPDAQTLLRLVVTNYKGDAAYVDRRIIGLPYERLVYDGPTGRVMARSIFHYDWNSPHYTAQAPSTQYDSANYPSWFILGRGNLVAVQRFNADAPYDDSQSVYVELFGYDMAGSRLWEQDAAGHRTSLAYDDSFSDGNNSRNTRAYPTHITDPDGHASTTQYNYATGAVMQTSRPSSGTAAQGNVTYETKSYLYDWVARLQRVTVQNTGAYTRFEYPAAGHYVLSYSTIVAGAGERYAAEFFDGVGRLRAFSSAFPGSAGGYRGVHLMRDSMGRVVQQTNPTEINASWVPSGDDGGGWQWTQQAFDWQGRPTLQTHPDGWTREMSYGGCGCAGGDVTTIRDERGRRRRFYNDTLGRLARVEELNYDQSVYSTTDYAYDSLDRLTQVAQQGQSRTYEYDGYGRLRRLTTPEQGATTYAYNSDDTLQSATDARGAVSSFGYNARHLVTAVNFSAPAGVAAAPNVTFAYDAGGNRTQMTDGMGSVSYAYDSLSRMTSETRHFSEIGGSYTISYGYNLAGQVTSVTNPWGAQFSYSYDFAGQVTGVGGANYGGVSSYASGLAYRATGALKQMTYGNGRVRTQSYDNRLRLTRWDVSGVLGSAYAYSTFYPEHTDRVMFADHLYDNTLDRSYEYDQVGRLSVSYTGAEANAHAYTGQWGVKDGPYAQRYHYDVFGNITQRQGEGGEAASYGPISFTNNRRSGFSYDAAGNLTNDLGQGFAYDAAGNQVTAWVLSGGYALSQWYDGENLRVKKNDNGDVVYYVRSTVLGGKVLAEIRDWGAGWAWYRGYVYMGGELLALQAGGVMWTHQDPVTKSQRITDQSGNVIAGIELDPWGGNTNRSWNTGHQPRKYTSYERDNNASDEAMMRRYNRWHSRFDQPDPFDGSYDFDDPQSLNRYTYGQNDPVNRVDPSGLMMCSAAYSFSECGGWGGIMGGYFGDDYAEFQREYGGMSREAAMGLHLHNQRVNNAVAGFGFITNEELLRIQMTSELCLEGHGCWDAGGAVWVQSISSFDRFMANADVWASGLADDYTFGFTTWLDRKLGRLTDAEAEFVKNSQQGQAGAVMATFLPGPNKLKIVKKAVDVTSKPRTVADALKLAEKWLGKGYKQTGDGQWVSADGKRRFRMTDWDLVPTRGKLGPHVHYERLNVRGKATKNFHVELIDP